VDNAFRILPTLLYTKLSTSSYFICVIIATIERSYKSDTCDCNGIQDFLNWNTTQMFPSIICQDLTMHVWLHTLSYLQFNLFVRCLIIAWLEIWIHHNLSWARHWIKHSLISTFEFLLSSQFLDLECRSWIWS